MIDILPWDQSNQETLESRIIRHEGFCSVPKIDVYPNFVVGFGHDISKSEYDNYSNGITWDAAESLLQSDIFVVKSECAKVFPWILGLSTLRQEVIWEMAFQMGIEGVSAFKNMIAAIRDQDWNKASQSMLDSAWHSETPSRCSELANLMKNGYIDNNSTS